MIVNVAKAVEFNAADIKEGKEKTKALEKVVRELKKESLELKEKMGLGEISKKREPLTKWSP